MKYIQKRIYFISMRFEWDEEKNAVNQRKHGVDFETASFVFQDPLHLPTQDRDVDGEDAGKQ